MSILIPREVKLLTQGLGTFGRRHTRLSIEYGTNVVGGVHPGRNGQPFEDLPDVPIFDTVSAAVEATGANSTMIFVPASGAADASMEAFEAGIELIVTVTEHIPALDMAKVVRMMEGSKARLIGPNSPGLIDPGRRVRMGITPAAPCRPGHIGIVSRSGTLTYEAAFQVSSIGLGQTTCLGLGGDPVPGTTFVDALAAFQEDDETKAIIMIGEIGGTAEEEAADFIRASVTKPVVAFIAGQTAPPGKRMGHAGAIIAGGKGTARDKIAALEDAGAAVAATAAEIGETLTRLLQERGVDASMEAAFTGA